MQINSSVKGTLSFLQNMKQQIPYGISVGLNNLAEHIRDSEISAAKNIFTLRGTWWKPKTRFGFNVSYAKKNNLKAEIYTRADWLNLHVTGGVKIPKGSNLALPSVDVKRNKKDIITRANRPKNIKNAFKINITTESGKKVSAIAKRVGRGKNKKIVVMYWLEKKANIKKEYDFFDIGKKVFDRNAEKYIKLGIEQAFRTAK